MRRPFSLLVYLLILGHAVVAGGKTAGSFATLFSVIVHSSTAVPTLTRSEISDLFLKKVTKWKDGRAVVPFDLADGSPIRKSFSHAVHGRDTPAIKTYWQQQIFSGRGVPPREVDSEEEVVRLVARTPGAIGYVSADATLEGVRVVRVGE